MTFWKKEYPENVLGDHSFYSNWAGAISPRFVLKIEEHDMGNGQWIAHMQIHDRKEDNKLIYFIPRNAINWRDGYTRRIAAMCTLSNDPTDRQSWGHIVDEETWERILNGWIELLDESLKEAGAYTFEWCAKPTWKHPSRDAHPGTHPSQAP